MTIMKLIDKDVVVAEIKRILSIYTKRYDELAKYEVWITAKEIEHRIQGLKETLSILDTIEVNEVDENFELPEKYKTCDWLQNYEFIGLTKEHIKRLNNTINILESLNEPTDAKYLKEIKDKLLEMKEVKEVDLEKECDNWRHNHFHGRRDKEASGEYLERGSQLDLAKHFYELSLKSQKGE